MKILEFIAETIAHGVCCGLVCAYVHYLIDKKKK